MAFIRVFFFFSSRRRHTRCSRDWSSDVCSSDLVGLPHVRPANWTPFIPPNTGAWGSYGWSGVLRGAGLVFFSYIGFDTVSTATQESKNPQRDMPIGILGS